jgi:hypothetical protein
MDMIWMNHPQLPADQLICQPEEAAIGHRTSGWQVTDPPPPDEVLEGPWGASDLEPNEPERELAPGAKYEAAVESRPDIKSALDGKEK